MRIFTIKTGSTLVSSAVPDRSTHKCSLAYTGLFQKRSGRIEVPVKCYYVSVGGHHFLVDAGWSLDVAYHPLKHLGFGLLFASEPVMKAEEAAVNQLKGKPVDAILMTHLDCDHVSGLKDFHGIPVYASAEEIAYSKKHKIRYGSIARGYAFKTFQFVADSVAPFGKSADVFGDGSVIAYLTPTHSAGSVIYRIADDGKFALVVGDNGYKDDSWEKGLLPGPLFDKENMRKCLAWIKDQSVKENCLGVFCAHNPKDYMKYRISDNIVVVEAIGSPIADADSVMDTVLSLKYETGVAAFAFAKNCFDEAFFHLSSGVAGEVIQKFVNYGIRAAVFGDFRGYTSKPLRDFIYESNKGQHFGFLATEQEAIVWLTRLSTEK